MQLIPAHEPEIEQRLHPMQTMMVRAEMYLGVMQEQSQKQLQMEFNYGNLEQKSSVQIHISSIKRTIVVIQHYNNTSIFIPHFCENAQSTHQSRDDMKYSSLLYSTRIYTVTTKKMTKSEGHDH